MVLWITWPKADNKSREMKRSKRKSFTTQGTVSLHPTTKMMFPIMSELFRMVFSMLKKSDWLIWSCPENCLSVWMSEGNYDHLRSFRWLNFFDSSKIVRHPDGPGQKFEDMV